MTGFKAVARNVPLLARAFGAPPATVVNLRDAMKDLTITVRTTGHYRVRFGLWLIRLGCWVCGCRFKHERES